MAPERFCSPRSDGNFRLGEEKYRKKLRFALASDCRWKKFLKRAKADLEADANRHLRNGVAALQKIFSKHRRENGG
jgi:hypothetical protein